MFNNVGEKIKTLTIVVFALVAMASIVAAIVLFSQGEGLAFVGFVVLLVGPFIAWIAGLFVYGYGELIQRTIAMEQELRKSNHFLHNTGAKPKCVKCGSELEDDAHFCTKCGNKID